MNPNTYYILVNEDNESSCYVETFEDLAEIARDFNLDVTAADVEAAMDINDDVSFVNDDGDVIKFESAGG